MQRRNCPKEEKLLEFVSMGQGLSFLRRLRLRLHTRLCDPCQKKCHYIQKKLDAYFQPEPEIASSLINVYSRLQDDETLILKGWKFDELGRARAKHRPILNSALVFRGGVATAVAGFAILFLMDYWNQSVQDPSMRLSDKGNRIPFAQIRFEDEDRTQIHYVRPELLQSVEFETTGSVR